MSNNWIDNELKTVNLKDKRLNNRLAEILKSLGEHPHVSIPAACGGHAETMAAYRFFDNDKTTFEKILQPHCNATEQRIAAQDIVLCVQDTTELDLTRPQQQIRGAGLIGSGDKRYGGYLHLLEAFVPDGTPLGAIWAKNVIRASEKPPKEQAPQRRKLNSIPIEEKESFRWLEGYRQTIELAKRNPKTLCVCVGDSESDMFEVFAEPRCVNAHWLVRMCHDRSVVQDKTEEETELCRIRDMAYQAPVLATKKIFIRARTPSISYTKGPRQQVRKSRNAELEIRSCRVTVSAPLHLRNRKDMVTMNVVLVSEMNPPEGEQSIEWVLLTTLPISTLAETITIVEYYTSRWMIEVFFKTLKSGCGVESLQFETMDRLLSCLAVYLIAAWRVLMICRLGRSMPETSCEMIFDESEWKSTYRIMHPEKPLPKKPPSMKEMTLMIGELGGWVATPGKTEPPGPQTTWIGLQRVYDFAIAWKMFGPEAKKYKKDV
ncbi:MAG: IS4 family transposase [Planctomycetaceae bacterium]|nr:IS4 family transposase [Planctomycetaceae bacterium]